MTVRIGFIGAGGNAKAHLNALQKLNHVTITAVHDIDKERADEFATSCGAHFMNSMDEVLNPELIDAVFISTPPFARGEADVVAASRGIHVFCEKPIGLDVVTVRRKEKEIREAGIITSSGYSLRSLSTVQQAKQYLAGKQLDMIVAARHTSSHPAKWWRQLDLSGGNFVEASTHLVDMVRYIAGEFREVNANFAQRSMKRIDPEATIHDVGVLHFALKSGCIGVMSDSCNVKLHPRADIEIYGHNFFVQLSNNGKSLRIIDEEKDLSDHSEQDVMYEQDRRFIEGIVTGDQGKVLCSYSDALESLLVTLAASRSSAENKTISIGSL